MFGYPYHAGVSYSEFFFEQLDTTAKQRAELLKPSNDDFNTKMRGRAFKDADHEELDQFGHLLMIDDLALMYNYSHEEITLMPDEFVFTLQLLNKRKNEFNSRYEKIYLHLTKTDK